VNIIQDFPNQQLEEDQIDSDLDCSYPSFEELCEEEIRMFNEINHQANHMESDLCYVNQNFEEIFEDGLLLLEELDRHTFPIGFFD